VFRDDVCEVDCIEMESIKQATNNENWLLSLSLTGLRGCEVADYILTSCFH
jgi:hypothetical protein